MNAADSRAISSYAEILHRQRRARLVDGALQVAIALLSMASISCLSTTGEWHRWGYVLGLASQPLWIAATWRARQWGMLALSIFYVGMWWQGIANRFFA